MVKNPSFESVSLTDLYDMPKVQLDQLPFGVVGLDRTGTTRVYNATEARMAGLDPDTVLGIGFFDAVAQCMNNFMVAQRFEDEPELDAVIPFVLTLRMRPTRVRLRLISSEAVPFRFILIER